MSETLFFITLSLLLLSRLPLTFEDNGASAGKILKTSAIPLLSLLLIEINMAWFLLLAYLVFSPAVVVYFETSAEQISKKRLFTLLMHIIVLGIIFSPLLNARPELYVVTIVYESGQNMAESLNAAAILFCGGLLVLNEMNIVLRYSLSLLKLEPLGDVDHTVSDSEYNTGRVIGMLERVFIFLFAVAGQFAAIGFILTAKGVVRYKEFENRLFAEYVLIGTLLSALLALLTALAVNGLL